MERFERKLQHVALPTAASIVHIQIMGVPPNARQQIRMLEVLNEVAHAIAAVVPIYAEDKVDAVPRKLTSAELMDGKFRRGARFLVTADGKEHGSLSVRRADIAEATALLRRVGVRFSK